MTFGLTLQIRKLGSIIWPGKKLRKLRANLRETSRPAGARKSWKTGFFVSPIQQKIKNTCVVICSIELSS